MQFSAGLPLKLNHPRMGDVNYAGIKFSGSPVAVFDRFVLLSIEDFVERHVHATEAAMEAVATPDLAIVARQASDLIASKRTLLLNRAMAVKGKLGQPGAVVGVVERVQVAQQLKARAHELKSRRADQTGGPPLLPGLERFRKANPALLGVVGFVISNLVSFAIGVGVAVVAGSFKR